MDRVTIQMPQVPGLQTGQAWPMGAQADASGVNFAVFSAHADALDLCLFDETGQQETARYRLPARTGDVWHGFLPGAGAGLIYGFRAYGRWAPQEGQRFNGAKLLLDPYAQDIVGHFAWRGEHFGHNRQLPSQADMRDNAIWALKSRVATDSFDWQGDSPPRIPLADTVLYELHVKGFSKCNPQVPEAVQGTFAGLAHPASIAHLKRLGITAVSLMPVHFPVAEERLQSLGLTNYWGYNTLGFFCADPRLATSVSASTPTMPGTPTPADEFRAMVRSLHQAGMEVILDVVFNHTAESDEAGPTLSFRGLDNASYYRLAEANPATYENISGCGNTLDIRQPPVLRLVMDSLRYWVQAVHVDGFRFDLAPVLGRGEHGFSAKAAFFTAVGQDPVLAQVKMIAEPWDLGAGGYQVGGFPRGWLEWNDHFRDSMRSFWLQSHRASTSQGTTRGDFALRLCGSADLYNARRRAPAESVNYVASHDGFTLRDLVTYQHRRNEANGENNRDGHGNNLSFNGGVEGPSDDPVVLQLRGRLQRALLATTLLAQGTPLLCAGAELGHTQHGNNNPYCQDNPTTWLDWAQADDDLTAFTVRVLQLRRALLPLGNHWYSGLTDPLGLHDLTWLEPDGRLVNGDAWQDPTAQALGCLIGQPGRARAPLLLLVNAAHHTIPFLLPAGVWTALLDTHHPRGETRWQGQGEAPFGLAPNSLVLLAVAGIQPVAF